jgi:inosine-uridine nucleoside N-ribohydrolase
MEQDNRSLLNRLRKPSGLVDVVLDTDTYNEIDDQFALALLVKNPKKMRLKAINAAPFFNKKSSSPSDGMEKSYDEILRILSLMERDDLKGIVKKGSTAYLPSETEPVDSPAARGLVELAQGYTEDSPLYIVAIGAITNVASAILMDPGIINRIVIVWLGGNAHSWPNTKEFNMRQDVAAARVVFGCGAALVQLPCMGVVSAFTTTGPELEHWLRGKNALCDYLVETTTRQALEDQRIPCWNRAIWDVCAVAWLLGEGFMEDYLCASPIPQYDHHYSFDPQRHPMRYVYHINRDQLFFALFNKLKGA